MRKISLLPVILLAALILQGQFPPLVEPGAKIRPALEKVLSEPENGGKTLHVWVYFRDKGLSDRGMIRRAWAETRAALRPHSVWRRSKMRDMERLVDYEDLPVSTEYSNRVQSLVGKVRTVSRWLNAVSVEADPEQVSVLSNLEFVLALDVVRGFRRDEPSISNRELTSSTAVPPDPLPPFKPLYGGSYRQLGQINVPSLHASGLTGQGVIVCMMDVGFRKTHQAFRSARIIAERDFVMGDNDVQRNPSDSRDYSDAHGTSTWSLLGGFAPGVLVGPAFGADFILARTEDDRSETPVEEDYWAAGIEWAESLGAEVVSSSLGYTDWYQFKDMDGKTAVTTKAAARAAALGVVVVNAAGNERRNAWGHIIAPADGYDVIAVGAVDATGRIASFSSPGPTADGRVKPEVCAMGVNNFVATSGLTTGDGTYVRGNGTSYATPLIGGVVALLLEAHRSWTPKDVRNALMKTANNAAAPNNDFGWGVIDAAAALLYR